MSALVLIAAIALLAGSVAMAIADGRPEERNRRMTAHEAKLRWPFYSKSIDSAVAEVDKHRYKSLEPTSSPNAPRTSAASFPTQALWLCREYPR